MKISIRYQILAIVVVVTAVGMGAYLTYATRFITDDKLAYVFDLSSSLAKTQAQEVSANIETLASKLRFLAAAQYAGADSDDAEQRVWPLLESNSELVALEIWERRGQRYVQVFHVLRDAALNRLNLDADDLVVAHNQAGLLPELVAAEDLLLRNTSRPNAPMITMALTSSGGRGVIIADVDAANLAQVLGGSGLFQTVLVDSQGRVFVHSDPSMMVARADFSEHPSVARALSSSLNQGVIEEVGPGGSVIAAFYRLGVGRLILITRVDKDKAMEGAVELRERTFLIGLALLLVTLVVGIFVSRMLTRPLQDLEKAVGTVGKGEFGLQIPVTHSNEIGALTAAFNEMSAQLAERDADLKNAYAQVQRADRLALMGTVTAGVAHELKNPLTYMLEAQKTLGHFFGARSAGVVASPDASTDAEAASNAARAVIALDSGLIRMQTVLGDLGSFTMGADDELSDVDIREILDGAIRMASHQISGSARVKTDFGEVPRIMANASRLGQVFLNLILNAGQALAADRRPAREIRVSCHVRPDGCVAGEVSDNGPGIAPDLRGNIFKAFFSTKKARGGSGLGLAISKAIIEKQGGHIEVNSEQGLGTTFRVVIPVAPTRTGTGGAAATESSPAEATSAPSGREPRRDTN